MPEPDTVKKPWERFAAKPPAAPSVEGPWTKFQDKAPKTTPSPTPVPQGDTAHTEYQKKEAAGDYESEYLKQDSGYQALKKFSQAPTPNWAQPGQYLNDPHWYGRSARYFGGELYGTAQAGAGVITGGWKMLNDLASAMNPFETPKDAPLSKVGTLAADVGKASEGVVDTTKDIGKIAWDLLRMHPETHADPAKFGQTISNAAMVVDGGIKGSKSMAEMLKTDPTDATRVAAKASSGVPSRFFRRKAFEDVYVHTKGLDVAKKVNKAAKAISEEAASHASNISSQIDTKIPTGVIDATAEATEITKQFKEAVKAPEAMNMNLRNMLADAKKTAPGQWTWEKVRQFRSSIGRSMGKVEGPQRQVLTRIYKDLTTKLGATAKQYGLQDSWNHYNELERKTSHQFADLIDDVNNAQSGKEVASKLSRDTALTGEMVRNLGKYGLDYSETMKFLKDAKRIADSQGKWKGTLFRMAYGSPAGVPAMLAVRGAGGGWMPSVLAGALTGYGFSHIINMARAMKLSPAVIEMILKERELPGKMPLGKGTFPSEGSPQLPSETEPTVGGGGPTTRQRLESGGKPEGGAPSGGGETPLDQAIRLRGAEAVETPVEKATREHRESPEGQREETSRKMIEQAKQPIKGRPEWVEERLNQAEKQAKSLGIDDKIEELAAKRMTAQDTVNALRKEGLQTKLTDIELRELVRSVRAKRGIPSQDMATEFEDWLKKRKAPPEAVGREPGAKPGTTRESTIGRRTKARERVAKGREEVGRTRQKEVEDAQARAQATDMNVSQLQIPEMEEHLRLKDPNAFSGLQKMRKAKAISDEEYTEALKYYILRNLEGAE